MPADGEVRAIAGHDVILCHRVVTRLARCQYRIPLRAAVMNPRMRFIEPAFDLHALADVLDALGLQRNQPAFPAADDIQADQAADGGDDELQRQIAAQPRRQRAGQDAHGERQQVERTGHHFEAGKKKGGNQPPCKHGHRNSPKLAELA